MGKIFNWTATLPQQSNFTQTALFINIVLIKILMKCEDFYAIGVVIYVERENSEAIRKIYFA